jgi:RecB family endonuclease NucS
MLFKISPAHRSLERVRSDWAPSELELESYLISQAEANVKVMSESVFGEPLLLVRKQVRTSTRTRADILALDRAGNGVIIELKKNAGRLGVETQALQYLADFSNIEVRTSSANSPVIPAYRKKRFSVL